MWVTIAPVLVRDHLLRVARLCAHLVEMPATRGDDVPVIPSISSATVESLTLMGISHHAWATLQPVLICYTTLSIR